MTDDEVFLSKLLNTFATLTKESNSGKHATSKFQLIVTDFKAFAMFKTK